LLRPIVSVKQRRFSGLIATCTLNITESPVALEAGPGFCGEHDGVAAQLVAVFASRKRRMGPASGENLTLGTRLRGTPLDPQRPVAEIGSNDKCCPEADLAGDMASR
jgi:hypothetical protein